MKAMLRDGWGLLLLLFFSVLSVPLWFASSGLAGDWAHWRGPEQNGVSREKDLPEKWSPSDNGENLVWKQPYGSRSTPLILNGRVYIIKDIDAGINEQEAVLCFDAETGKKLWEHRFNVFFTDIVSNRVGWTNLAGDPETGNVYAHGVQGLLFCFDKDGKIIWSRSLTEEYGRITGYGGRVTTPIVDGDLVIVGMVQSSWGDQARGGNRYVAFDKKTGEVVWWSEPGGPIRGTYYSCPVVAVINGQRLLISGGSDGAVHAMKVRTGEPVWSFPVGNEAINSSPVVAGSKVYISTGLENPGGGNVLGRVVCLDAGQVTDKQPKLVWENRGLKARMDYASPLVHEGRLYVCNDSAKMYCYNADTGKIIWDFAYGRLARGSPVWADGKIYVFDVNAHFHILKPGKDDCEELHDQFFPSPDGKSFVETNGTPAIANGKIYLATRDWLYCIGKKGHSAKPDPIPPQPEETKFDANAKPAVLQVVPADVVAKPGAAVGFKARLLDGNGRLLKETTAKWSLPTPPLPPGAKMPPPPLQGGIADGKLVVAQAPPSQQGYVLAEADGLTGRARVRVAPVLPYLQNFENSPVGTVPGGWVNAQGKFVVVELPDKTKALKKLATDPRPPLARANAYITLPTSNYTMQADLMANMKRNTLPDMGIINSRYNLMLDGQQQLLHIQSWEALPRVDHTVAWKWQPDVWYRARLGIEYQNGKAVIRGKVWPRDQAEPANWSIEFTDPRPNPAGSPALYGYVPNVLEDDPGSEIFYDNVMVTPAK